MLKKTYSDKLKDPRWQKKRLQIFNRDKFACKLCKDETQMLQVHHKRYTGEPWEAPDEDLITLCSDCHTAVSDVKKKGYDVAGARKIYYSDETRVLMTYYTEERGMRNCVLYLGVGPNLTSVSHSIGEEIVSELYQMLGLGKRKK